MWNPFYAAMDSSSRRMWKWLCERHQDVRISPILKLPFLANIALPHWKISQKAEGKLPDYKNQHLSA